MKEIYFRLKTSNDKWQPMTVKDMKQISDNLGAEMAVLNREMLILKKHGFDPRDVRSKWVKMYMKKNNLDKQIAVVFKNMDEMYDSFNRGLLNMFKVIVRFEGMEERLDVRELMEYYEKK